MNRFYCFAFLLFTSATYAQLPPDFYDQKLDLNLENPMGFVFDEEGNMFIWEKNGEVRFLDANGDLQSESVIDISEEVSNWNDHGLIGFALDPFFNINGKVYLLYAVDLHHYQYDGTPTYHPDTTVVKSPTFGRLTSYQLHFDRDQVQVDYSTRKVLIGQTMEDGIPLLWPFHGLGTVLIAEDGTLLVSVGNSSTGLDLGKDPENEMIPKAIEMGLIEEGADIGSYRSQYLGSYGGKILRIDPATGNGLESNPFYDPQAPRSPESRIWAYGFRNPFRITTFPNTGSHYPGDGQPGIILGCDVGDGAWEEINLVTEGGQNFGWPITEGFYWNWAFHQQPTPFNDKAPNSLFKTGNCDQEFFSFRDLIQWPNALKPAQFTNPCAPGELIDQNIPTAVLSFPAISWSHQKWNKPSRAQIPALTDKGNVTGIALDEAQDRISGDNFDGYSSIAGVFYDSNEYPEFYRGKFFSTDHSGWIKVFEFNDQYEVVSVSPFHNDVKNIIHLDLNPVNGSIYYLSTTRGIHRISYGGSLPPTPIIQADKYFGPGPLSVAFDATASESLFAPIVEYHWDFGDGVSSNQAQVEHQFTTTNQQIRSFDVTLTVTDSLGQSSKTKAIISINNTPPKANIISIRDGDKYPIDNSALLSLEAKVSDTEHSIEELDFAWRIFFHHNDHFHPEPVVRSQTSYALLTPVGCELEEYWYRIELEVIDPAGLKAFDSKLIYPDCNSPFASIQLNGDGDQELVKLSWDVEFGNNIQQYEIQRSQDFLHFKKLAEIPANQLSELTYTDVTPLKGNNIYRIKAINQDSAFRYSNLLTISHPTQPDFLLFPNPATNQLNLNLKNTVNSKIDFKVFNNLGQLILKKHWETVIGTPFNQTLSIINWNNGTYHYLLQNGEQEIAGSFLVRK